MSEARKPRIPHHPAPGRHIEPPSNYPEEADRVTGKIRKSSKYTVVAKLTFVKLTFQFFWLYVRR